VTFECPRKGISQFGKNLRDNRLDLWQHTFVTALPLDTHRLVSQLKASGFTDEQAAGVTEALKEIDLSQLSTKADLKDLELRILKWMIPLLLCQTAVFAIIVKWLVV
jgi:hypothetical protein